MLVKFSGHIDVKFPSIVSKLDSFLLLAKIKGEVALTLLAAPSYVHVPSPLQVKWPVINNIYSYSNMQQIMASIITFLYKKDCRDKKTF
jgi:hypothetical protein